MKTYEIESSANQVIPHTGAILTASTAHEHDAMLLDIVALARDIGRHYSSRRQTHTRCFSLARIGFLGSRDSDFEAHSLLERRSSLGECWRNGVARLLSLPTTLFTLNIRS